jgi:hypothetical protein
MGCPHHVRFTPVSDRIADVTRGPVRANRRHKCILSLLVRKHRAICVSEAGPAEAHLQPKWGGLFSRTTLSCRIGQQVLHRDHLLPSLAATVALAATVFCPQASAQDYLAIKQRALVAQAGSTGGSIGKTDKSISDGGEQQSSTPRTKFSRPANRNSNKEESFPKTIQLNDRAYGLSYSITLRNVGGNNYLGTWSHGYVTKFTVTAFTRDSIEMKRNDNPAFGSVSGSYTGSRTGNRATGEAIVSNGATSKWDASW